MDLQVNSGEIISACLKHYGEDELFFRTDGLAFEARRAAVRHQYLDSNDAIEPAHHEAILKAAITPGMTREQVIAAWGLIEEDTRTAFGHVTEERRRAFACFTGIEVGTRYSLYFQDHILAGVRQTDVLTLYMRAPQGTTVVHEEHHPLQIPPGEYHIGIVREYDHFPEEKRKPERPVAD